MFLYLAKCTRSRSVLQISLRRNHTLATVLDGFSKLKRKFIPSYQWIFWKPRENVEHRFEEGLENYQLSHGQAYVGIPLSLTAPSSVKAIQV